MKLEKLSQHLFDFHDITFYGDEDDSSAEEWIDEPESWRRKGTPTPITSESENEVSDNEVYPSQLDSENEVLENNSNDKDKEPTLVHQLQTPPANHRNSYSSSDSSSGNISSGQSKKKSRSSRTFDKFNTKLSTVESKAETDQQKNESRFKTLDENQTEAKNHLHTLNGKMDVH